MPSSQQKQREDVDTTKIFTKDSSQHLSFDLQKKIEESIEWSQKVFEQNKIIKRRLGMIVFLSYVKLVFIFVPLILGIIFLPPLLKDVIGQYEALFGMNDSDSSFFMQNIMKSVGGNVTEEQVQGIIKAMQEIEQ